MGFNFYNAKEKTYEFTKERYDSERKKYFSKNQKLLHSYVDRLIKVFGGRELENADYNNYLEERLNKRSCKDEIINLINSTGTKAFITPNILLFFTV